MNVCAVLHTGTDGEVTFLNVEGGEHRVRVIAWDTPTDSDTVIRSRVVLMPDDSDFCSLNAINKGVTKTYDSNGMPANYTIEWRPIGNDVGFFCVLGDSDTPVECQYTNICVLFQCAHFLYPTPLQVAAHSLCQLLME